MRRKIFQTGHSSAITISRNLLKELGLKVGDTVSVELGKPNDHLVIKPDHPKTQLSLNLTTRRKF